MRQMFKTKVAPLVLAAVMVATGALVVAGHASAAAASCNAGREIRNVKFVKTRYVWPDDPDWRVSGWGPNARLRVGKGNEVKVGNSYSVGFGIPKTTVTSSVGFDVAESKSTIVDYTASLPKKAHYTLRAGKGYKDYKFDVYERKGNWVGPQGLGRRCHPTKTWKKIGTGKASRFWTIDYKLTKGPVKN